MALDCSPGQRPNLSLYLWRFPSLILVHIYKEYIRGGAMQLTIRGMRKKTPTVVTHSGEMLAMFLEKP